MKFSKVKAMRIPNGNTVRIRHGGKTLWIPILARYVSLGDSIAAGHAITDDWYTDYGTGSQYGQNGRTETALVPNCYTDLIHRDLTAKRKGTVNTVSFARSGDTVADLMAKLDHSKVRTAISKADYVTVCIGANDVLEPAMSQLEVYINSGDLSGAESIIENNFARLNDDNNATSFKALLDKLSALNPDAKFVFTTIYNPYKYLWLDEGANGFFKPILDVIPNIGLDVDKIVEDRFFGGKDLAYYDFKRWKWVSIELNLDVDELIKAGLLNTSIVRKLFSRVNGLCDWSERYVNRLNELLRSKINAYKSVNPNFFLAETKAVFDTYPDRNGAGDVHYNDLVNVEFTRGYDTAKMDWGALWRGSSAANFWNDLVAKHTYWKWGFPSTSVSDYVDFHLEDLAVDLVTQIVEKVIVPNVDPHPETQGHAVLKGVFSNFIN